MPATLPRIEALAMSLARLGWPARFTRLAAAGILARLHRWCQDHWTDALGSAGDVAWLVPEWGGDPKVLAAALVSAGILIVDRQTEGFWVWRALLDAPVNTVNQWRRQAPESARIAALHSKGVYGYGDAPEEQPLEENERGNAYQTLRSRWDERWRLRHPGCRYPWDTYRPDGPRIGPPTGPNCDAWRIKRCLRAVKGPGALAALGAGIARYLADPSPFYGGHPLYGFVAEIGRWVDGGAARLR
jgi:hypothetical protein